MNKLIVGVLLALVPLLGMSSGGGVHLDSADLDMGDQASLQRGLSISLTIVSAVIRLNTSATTESPRTWA